MPSQQSILKLVVLGRKLLFTPRMRTHFHHTFSLNMSIMPFVLLLLLVANAAAISTRSLLQAPAPVQAPPRCERPTTSNNNLGVSCEGLGREWSGDEIDCRWAGSGFNVQHPWCPVDSTHFHHHLLYTHQAILSSSASTTQSCFRVTKQPASWTFQAWVTTASLTAPSSMAGYAMHLSRDTHTKKHTHTGAVRLPEAGPACRGGAPSAPCAGHLVPP